MIITLSGAAGSGKSTIAQKLANELSWPRYYIGGIRREMAKKRGMTLAEYNKLGESDPLTDHEPDKYQENLGKTKDNFIIEGRTSWYFIPHSIKIYLDVSLEESARRIFLSLQKDDSRNEDVNLKNIEDVKRSIKERAISDDLRYEKYYGINIRDKKHYDLYLDTTNMEINDVFLLVLDFVKKRLDKEKKEL